MTYSILPNMRLNQGLLYRSPRFKHKYTILQVGIYMTNGILIIILLTDTRENMNYLDLPDVIPLRSAYFLCGQEMRVDTKMNMLNTNQLINNYNMIALFIIYQ